MGGRLSAAGFPGERVDAEFPVPRWVHDAYERVARATTERDDDALARSVPIVAGHAHDDAARVAAIEVLLATEGGREALAYLAAAGVSVRDDELVALLPAPEPPPEAAAQARRTSWYGTPTGLPARPSARRAAAAAAGAAPAARRRTLPRGVLLVVLAAIVGAVWLFTRDGLPLGIGTTGETVALTESPAGTLGLVEPRGTLEAPPTTLVWAKREGTVRYVVELRDADDAVVVSVETRGDTTATVPGAVFEPGSYRWSVRALRADGTELATGNARFSVR